MWLNWWDETVSSSSDQETVQALGYLLAGAGLRLAELIREKRYDRVFFLSREGLVLQRAVRAHPLGRELRTPLTYLLTSRRCLSLASCRSIADCYRLLDVPFHPQPLSQLLFSRYGIGCCGEESGQIVSRHEKVVIRKALKRQESRVLGIAAAERDGYLAYLSLKGMLPGGRYLLVDVGYNGTFHRSFEKLVPHAYFESFCLAAFNGARELVRSGKMHLFFDGVRDNQLKKDPISRNVPCLETLLMAPHASLVSARAAGDGRVSFLFAPGSSPDREIAKLQAEALRMIPAMVDVPLRVAAANFEAWLGNPPVVSVLSLVGHKLDDDFGGQGVRPLVGCDACNKTLSFKDAVMVVESSGWRDGALALLRSYQIGPASRPYRSPAGAGLLRKLRKIFRSREAFMHHIRVTTLKAVGCYEGPRSATQDIRGILRQKEKR